jgi:hypothetical protein
VSEMEPFVSNVWQDQSLSPLTYLQIVCCLIEGIILAVIVYTWDELISPGYKMIAVWLIALFLPSSFRLANGLHMTIAISAASFFSQLACFWLPALGYASYLCIAESQAALGDYRGNALDETRIDWRRSRQTVLKATSFVLAHTMVSQGPLVVIHFLYERVRKAFIILAAVVSIPIIWQLFYFKWLPFRDLLEISSFWAQDRCWKVQRDAFEVIEKWWIGFNGLEKYTYKALEERKIRLFCISRRTRYSTLLKGKILHADLDNPPPYEAISYTWGDITRSKKLLVDGCQFAVSAGLHELLEALSSPKKQVLLWVDYICINQDDEEDKAKQIPVMRDIYQRAFRTVAWLGAPYDAPLAVAMLLEVLDVLQLPDYQPIAMNDRYFPETERPRWIAFVRLLRHQYFSRVWVCQEVAVSRCLEFYLGGKYFSWETLMMARTALQHPHVTSLVTVGHVGLGNIRSLRNATTMGFFRSLIAKGIQIPLGFALSFSQQFGCKMPEDRVFALLGLCSSEELKLSILQDVGKPHPEVYSNTTKRLLTSRENSVHTLQYSGIGYYDKERLPTWCVDWSSEPTGTKLTIPYLSQAKGVEHSPISGLQYLAAGASEPHILEGALPGTLQIGGVKVDVIKKVSHVMTWAFPEASTTLSEVQYVEFLMGLLNFLIEAAKLAKENLPSRYRNGQLLTNAIWRTVIADRSADERPAPAIFHQYYVQWLHTMRLLLNQNLRSGQLSALADSANMSNSTYKQKLLGETLYFNERFIEASSLRRFCITEGGFMGLVAPNSDVGDAVCLIWGMQTPYILRVAPDQDMNLAAPLYQLIGECYMHGMMDGEMADADKESTFTVA